MDSVEPVFQSLRNVPRALYHIDVATSENVENGGLIA